MVGLGLTFFKEIAELLPMWLYHFTLPSVGYESSSCSISSYFSIINFKIIAFYFIFISLRINDFEHFYVFTCTCISSLMKCLLKIFAYFLEGDYLFPQAVSFEIFKKYILDISPLSDK